MRILVAYSLQSTFVQNTLDYLTALQKHLQADVDFVHVTHGAIMDFDMAQYDAVFHSYCARLCFPGYVSSHYLAHLRRFRGLKVLAVQDEYDETDALKAAIRDLQFDVVLTCTPEEPRDYVYPAAEFPGVRFERVLTGYVSDDLVSAHGAGAPLRERPIVLGYRGRDIGGRYGRLGYEKYIIGVRMKEICTARGVRCDIAVDEQSRIYGSAWFDFVGACRAMLGSESGSNVFDFDGSIARTYQDMAKARGGAVSYEDFEPIVRAHEEKIDMGQISPRVFECAVMRTPMVLFRGRYSDAILPDVHYIPLDKDFSNADHVLDRLSDIPALEAMAQRAYDHLVGSGEFSYRAFGARTGQIIREEIARRRKPPIHADPIPQPDQRDLQLRGQRPTPAPGSHEIFLDEQNRYYAGVYGDEVKRLNAEIARHMGVLHAEIARLNAVYQSSRHREAHSRQADGRQAVSALPDARFAASCRRGADEDAAFREAENVQQTALKTAPAPGAWKRMSTLYQERIAALNAHLTQINAAYEDLVGRANVLILLNTLEGQALGWRATEETIVREKTRLEHDYAVEHARIAAMSAGQWRHAGPPARLDLTMPCPPDRMEEAVASLRHQAHALGGEPVDWTGVSREIQDRLALAARQRSDYLAAWDSAARRANQAFAEMAAAARGLGIGGARVGARAALLKARVVAQRLRWGARTRARELKLAVRLGPRCVLAKLHAVWRRLRAR